MKRRFSCLLALIMLISVMGICAFAEGEETPAAEKPSCGAGLTWNFSGGTLTVTGSGAMDDFRDGAPWEMHRDAITAVVLEGGVTKVGAHAFENCKKLRSVQFGDSLTEIGEAAFKGCDSLGSIELPASFRTFGPESFRDCPGLKEIHCAGRFPKFRQNCLLGTRTKIYFPADNPWSVKYIAQLEEAFHGRVEFLASDGTDPYTPTEPPKQTNPPKQTEPPKTEGTEETTEETLPPIPTASRSTDPTTEPKTEPTEESETTAPTASSREPERQEAEQESEYDESWLPFLAVIVLIIGVGAIVITARVIGGKNGRYSS